MTRDDWLKAAEAHRKAADAFLLILEPDAALIEMNRMLDAEREAEKIARAERN